MSLDLTKESLLKIREALRKGGALPDDHWAKAWLESNSAITGITYYDLELGAKELYPVITPLRNAIARMSGGKGIQANWRSVTGININSLEIGVSEANRGGVIATQIQNNIAAFAGMGLEDYVSYEADYAADGFDDVKALAMQGLLRSLMIGEEKVILGNLGTYGLGQANQPAATDNSAAGGSIPYNTLVSIYVAPLSLNGVLTGSIAGGVRGLVTRTNADQSTDQYGGGTGKVSANRQITTANDANNAHTISVSTASLTGALGYAWFWGPAGQEVLGAITTINSAVLTTAAGTGTQTAASLGANDNSNNTLMFDGLLAQIYKGGSNAYVAVQATGTAGTGTPLTADGYGGVVEIDMALQHFWDVWRLSPNTIWVNSQEQKNITHKVLTGNSASGAQRFTISTEQGNVTGGDLVTSYLNKFTMDGAKSIPIKLHPNMPPGTLMFDTDVLPYQLSGVPRVKQMRMRRDYYSIAWPPKARKYEYGVYCDGVLQNYFPPAFGAISNIGNG